MKVAEATYSETYRHRRRIPRLPDDLVSYREASILLKKSRSTLRRLVIEGELDTIYIGGGPKSSAPQSMLTSAAKWTPSGKGCGEAMFAQANGLAGKFCGVARGCIDQADGAVVMLYMDGPAYLCGVHLLPHPPHPRGVGSRAEAKPRAEVGRIHARGGSHAGE